MNSPCVGSKHAGPFFLRTLLTFILPSFNLYQNPKYDFIRKFVFGPHSVLEKTVKNFETIKDRWLVKT